LHHNGLAKVKVLDNDFDSVEQNEKGLDMVVGIDMLLVMVFTHLREAQ